jgi:hypothetical protein
MGIHWQGAQVHDQVHQKLLKGAQDKRRLDKERSGSGQGGRYVGQDVENDVRAIPPTILEREDRDVQDRVP